MILESPNDRELRFKALRIIVELEETKYIEDSSDLLIRILKMNSDIGMAVVLAQIVLPKYINDRNKEYFLKLVLSFYERGDDRELSNLQTNVISRIERIDSEWYWNTLLPRINDMNRFQGCTGYFP